MADVIAAKSAFEDEYAGQENFLKFTTVGFQCRYRHAPAIAEAKKPLIGTKKALRKSAKCLVCIDSFVPG